MLESNYYLSTSDSDSDENNSTSRLEKKFLRNSSTSLMQINRYKELFRLNKQQFDEVINLIRDDLNYGRKDKISPEAKLMVAFRFYAIGSYQRVIGEEYRHPVSQKTVSNIIQEVTDILENKLCPLYIKFPKTIEEKFKIKEEFFNKTGFFGVVGCIDCTHVDRFGKHSMNVQLICDYNLQILSVVSRFPGSTHDAAIWEVSQDRAYMKQCWDAGDKNSWLLDSGYPLQPWLMTPYASATTPQMERYNFKHTRARNPIERCNGVLKIRFRCLSDDNKLRHRTEKVSSIINVCCALHNLCLRQGEENINVEVANIPNEIVEENLSNSIIFAEGQRMRDRIAARF